jgi:hypothetical protein
MIEIMVVMIVLTISMAMFSSTLVGTARQNANKREVTRAAEGARRQLEILRSEPFDQIFALYNPSADDDPPAAAAPGAAFDVEGLEAVPGDPDGRVGEVVFASTGPTLREDAVHAALGMPRDLSGDLAIDDGDHSGDYIILPVLVRVRWQGATGPHVLEMQSLFTDL